jgi:hypothetical protein
MKVYHGRRSEHGCAVDVEENGECCSLNPRLDLRNHSPTGNGEFAVISTRSRFPGCPANVSSVYLA